MIARLLRNAKIPNGTFEPATTKSIIVMVESFVGTGTHSGRSHILLLTIVTIKEISL